MTRLIIMRRLIRLYIIHIADPDHKFRIQKYEKHSKQIIGYNYI